jgi:hypothetical protein
MYWTAGLSQSLLVWVGSFTFLVLGLRAAIWGVLV